MRSVALALTGWDVDLATGVVSFDESVAHGAPVTFLGETKIWRARSVVDRLVADAATHARVAGLLYTSLVGAEPTPEQAAELGTFWAGVGLDVRPLVRHILLGDDFKQSRLCRPRSPLEFATAVRSIVGHSESELWRLLLLGQAPFHPPNVGGWPSGEAWLTLASLMPRAQMVASLDFIDPISGATSSVDGILDRCGIHEITNVTLAALRQVEDDPQVGTEETLRQARLRLVLASPEFQLS